MIRLEPRIPAPEVREGTRNRGFAMVLDGFSEVEKQFPRKMGMGQVPYEIAFNWRGGTYFVARESTRVNGHERTHPTPDFKALCLVGEQFASHPDDYV